MGIVSLDYGIDEIHQEKNLHDRLFPAIMRRDEGLLRTIWVHTNRKARRLHTSGRKNFTADPSAIYQNVDVGRQDFQISCSDADEPAWAIVEAVRDDGQRHNILYTVLSDGDWLKSSLERYLAAHQGVVDHQFHTIGAFSADPSR